MQALRAWCFSLRSALRARVSKTRPAAAFSAGLLWIFLAMAGCSPLALIPWPWQTEIQFETIEQHPWPKDGPGYNSPTLSAAILTTRDELDRIQEWVSSDAFLAAQSLNFEDYFCIAIFQGIKPGEGYAVGIEKMLWHEEEISIQVQVKEPAPGVQPSGPATAPYHLVKIKKDLGIRGLRAFRLIVPGSPLVILEKIIP